MTKVLNKFEIAIPTEDTNLFITLVEKMGWSIISEISSNIPSKNKTIENDPLLLNITLTNYYNIRKGKKKIYRHSIKDINCAYKLFRHDNGEICINNEFKLIKREWTYTDNHEGKCPFIVRQYKNAVFTCEALNKKLEVEIDGKINVKLNKEANNWYFEFKIGKFIK